jgi:hypothetical protein
MKYLGSKEKVKLKPMHYTLTGKIGKREEGGFERQ